MATRFILKKFGKKRFVFIWSSGIFTGKQICCVSTTHTKSYHETAILRTFLFYWHLGISKGHLSVLLYVYNAVTAKKIVRF